MTTFLEILVYSLKRIYFFELLVVEKKKQDYTYLFCSL